MKDLMIGFLFGIICIVLILFFEKQQEIDARLNNQGKIIIVTEEFDV